MGEIKLLKIKLVKKETITVTYAETEKDKTQTIVTKDYKGIVHQDFRNSMVGLRMHFALLSDYIPMKAIKDITKYDSDLVEPFHVTGINQGGAEDESYIILTGHKITAAGKAVIINTPMTRVEEDDKSKYRWMDELMALVKNVEGETKEYMAGKHAPEAQSEFDFDPKNKDAVTHAQVLPPATPGGIVADIVNQTNSGIDGGEKEKVGGRKGPQTAQNKTGAV